MSDFPISLENIRVASPCPANWDEMTPTDPNNSERSRFCGQCQLNVSYLSDMSKSEAEELIASKEGRLCVRYYMREDGTVITKDCPVGVEIKHKKVLHLKRAGVAAAIAFVTFTGIFTAKSHADGATIQNPQAMAGSIMLPPHENQPEMMGEMIAPKQTPPEHILGKPTPVPPPIQGSPMPNPPQQDNNNNTAPENPQTPHKMGKVIKQGEIPAPPAEVRGRMMVEMGDIADPTPPPQNQ